MDIVKSKVIRYGDNVDTDVIIPARFLNIPDMKELSTHAMEDLDKDFLKKSQTRSIIVAGDNFGCGSSREHAPLVIKEVGIKCVIAKSFARIFYRNSINICLPIIELNEVDEIEDNNELELDFENGKVLNVTTHKEYAFLPFPEFLQSIIKSGGLLKTLE